MRVVGLTLKVDAGVEAQVDFGVVRVERDEGVVLA